MRSPRRICSTSQVNPREAWGLNMARRRGGRGEESGIHYHDRWRLPSHLLNYLTNVRFLCKMGTDAWLPCIARLGSILAIILQCSLDGSKACENAQDRRQIFLQGKALMSLGPT